MEVGRIYLITNIVNDKKYVRQTIKPIEKRLKEHFKAFFSEKRKTNDLAKQYSVSKGVITKIVTRENWGHI